MNVDPTAMSLRLRLKYQQVKTKKTVFSFFFVDVFLLPVGWSGRGEGEERG